MNWQERLHDIVVKGTLVQGLIALMIVSTACYQAIAYKEMSSDIKELTFITVSFFIGGIVQYHKSIRSNGVK